MKPTTEYQVCAIDKDAKTATALETISADNLQNAVDIANGKYPRDTIRVYPLVTLENADSITEMARFTLASYENWERRNNYAVMNPAERNQWDREDLLSIATIAIIATLTDNHGATMYDVKSAAFSAVATEQRRRERNSEREYMPGWIGCNVMPREARSSCPALDKLIISAVDNAELSATQAQVLMMSYSDGMSAIEIAQEMGKNRSSVYKNLYRAYYWVLSKAAELDGAELPTFKRGGYTAEDVAEMLVTLRQRGGMDKRHK